MIRENREELADNKHDVAYFFYVIAERKASCDF